MMSGSNFNCSAVEVTEIEKVNGHKNHRWRRRIKENHDIPNNRRYRYFGQNFGLKSLRRIENAAAPHIVCQRKRDNMNIPHLNWLFKAEFRLSKAEFIILMRSRLKEKSSNRQRVFRGYSGQLRQT